MAIVSDEAPDHPEPDLRRPHPGEDQFVFLDTPGLHKAANRLGDYMVDVVKKSVADVDAVLLLVEPIPNVGKPEAELIAQIKAMHLPAVLVINKIDTVDKPQPLAVMDAYRQAHDFAAILPHLRQAGRGAGGPADGAGGLPPEGPRPSPLGWSPTSRSGRSAGEILREALYCLDKEIPHGTAVEVTKFSERENGMIDLHATIYCEKDSHKGHHHRQAGGHAEEDLHHGPGRHGALLGTKGLPGDLGEGQGALAG